MDFFLYIFFSLSKSYNVEPIPLFITFFFFYISLPAYSKEYKHFHLFSFSLLKLIFISAVSGREFYVENNLGKQFFFAAKL